MRYTSHQPNLDQHQQRKTSKSTFFLALLLFPLCFRFALAACLMLIFQRSICLIQTAVPECPSLAAVGCLLLTYLSSRETWSPGDPWLCNYDFLRWALLPYKAMTSHYRTHHHYSKKKKITRVTTRQRKLLTKIRRAGKREDMDLLKEGRFFTNTTRALSVTRFPLFLVFSIPYTLHVPCSGVYPLGPFPRTPRGLPVLGHSPTIFLF